MTKVRICSTATVLFFLMTAFGHAAVLLDKVVAVVNQDVITWSELYKSMEMDASPQIKELDGKERERIFKEGEPAYLETLINLKLQLQEAKKLGITATDENVDEAVKTIRDKYSMTEEEFQASLKKEGFTPAEYKEKIREQIMVSKVVNSQIRSKIVVSDADVTAYIAAQKDSPENSPGYRMRQIFFRKSDSNDRQAIEAKAKEVLDRLKDGANFEELAKNYSEDSSARAGGDMGLIRKTNLLPEFAHAVDGMKAGGISSPFWTDQGLHIVKVEEIVPGKDAAEIKEEARNKVLEKLFSERYKSWIKGLRANGFIEVRL